MNWNRIRRKDHAKSPSISSTSSSFSGSNVSTSSAVAELSCPEPIHQAIYGRPQEQNQCQCQHIVPSHHHHHHQSGPQPPPPTSHGGYDQAEYGTISTIKRKPNLNPVIPLTSTTRNMARQSEDALIEINEQQPANGQQSNGAPKPGENRNQYYGTLRRSNTDERIQINQVIYDSSRAMGERGVDGLPLRHAHSSTSSSGVYSIGNGDRSSPSRSSARSIGRCSSISTTNESDEDDLIDELDNLPPPPDNLKMSLSTMSLASLPPPPPEFLDSEYGSPDDSDCLSSSTPKAMSPTIEVAPSSRYNSFDRTLTRKHGRSCKQPATHFGTGPRRGQNRPSVKPAGLNGAGGCPSSPQSLSPSQSLTDCDCSPISDLPPPLPSLHAINALHSINQESRYKPMYSSSSSCDSTSHDDYTSSCATDTTISRQSPDRFDVLDSLEQQFETQANHHLNNHPQIAHVAPTIISPQQRPVASLLSDNEPVKKPLLIGSCNYKPTAVAQNNGHTNQPQQQSQQSQHANNDTYVVKEKQVIIAASYNDPPPERSPCKGPLPQAPDEFLKDLIKVMDKKWKVALSLSCDQAPQPGQVLGFRDAHPLDAMLPTPNQHQQPQQQAPLPQQLTALAPSSGPMIAHSDSSHYGERKQPMQLAAVRPSIKQHHHPISSQVAGPTQPLPSSSFAPQFKAAIPAAVQAQQQQQQRPNMYQSSFQQQSFQLQHRLQQGHNSGPLPVPIPFHRKKPPPPAPPRRSGSKLTGMKILG